MSRQFSLHKPPLFRAFLATLTLCGVTGFILPTSVEAAVASHHAGYSWDGDGTSFLGSYRLADGTVAYCIDQPSGPAVGVDYSSPNYSTGVADNDSRARLAYLMRHWGGSSDPTVAAAVALNVWRITGLNGKTDAYYAARANDAQGSVLRNADTQLAEARVQASRGVSANATLTIPTDGSSGLLQTDLTVERLSGVEVLPAGTHAGFATLTGGTFAETGNASASITNAVSYTVVPDPHAVISVSVEVKFDSLPYGGDLGILAPHDPSRQRLLTTTPATAAARAQAHSGIPIVNPLPFQPIVQTQTSSPVAEHGAAITDHITVSVEATAANPFGEWGMQSSFNGSEPIVVPVISSLWGPFTELIEENPIVPEGAPHVCDVETLVTGAGNYETPPCTLPGSGFYVWTEQIDASPSTNGATILPWTGPFGVASEITTVRWKPSVVTRTSHTEALPGTCISDAMTITNSREGHELPLTARLWGPFTNAPVEGIQIDPASPELGNVTILTQGNGDFVTPCLMADTEGFYVWTYESTGADSIRPFSSREVFSAESTHIRAQPSALLSNDNIPPVPPVEPTLAVTGVDRNSTNTAFITALTIITVGGAMIVTSIVMRTRRRKCRTHGRRSALNRN